MEDKKYIKIVFRTGDPIWLSLDKWESILNSEQTLVAYRLDNESEWSGRTLNKSDVVFSFYDKEMSQKLNARPYKLYRRKSTGVVVQVFEGELADDLADYEKLD